MVRYTRISPDELQVIKGIGTHEGDATLRPTIQHGFIFIRLVRKSKEEPRHITGTTLK